jgi:maltokinase
LEAAAGTAGTVVAAFPLGLDMTVMVEETGDLSVPTTYRCAPRRRSSTSGWLEALEGDGAAEVFVDHLRHHISPAVDGFRLMRVVPPPEASGERELFEDEDAAAVAVGERVVVRWNRRVADRPHPAPLTLAHLEEVGFHEVPTTHGMLLWTAPSGREVPCALATGYLPRARDGRQWVLDLVEEHLGLTGGSPRPDPWVKDAPARLGRLAARMHLALARSSRLVPEAIRRADGDTVRTWHAAITRRLDSAIAAVSDGSVAWAAPRAAEVLLPRRERLSAAVDALLEVAKDPDGVIVQRVHGDLHIGQVLRWPGGLAVTDFDGVPGGGVGLPEDADDPGATATLLPAAWDVARLLRSVDRVGRAADRKTGFTVTAEVDEWVTQARRDLLKAYREELAATELRTLLDDRLLEAFEVDQACRGILDAVEGIEPLPGRTAAVLAALRNRYPVD